MKMEKRYLLPVTVYYFFHQLLYMHLIFLTAGFGRWILSKHVSRGDITFNNNPDEHLLGEMIAFDRAKEKKMWETCGAIISETSTKENNEHLDALRLGHQVS